MKEAEALRVAVPQCQSRFSKQLADRRQGSDFESAHEAKEAVHGAEPEDRVGATPAAVRD